MKARGKVLDPSFCYKSVVSAVAAQWKPTGAGSLRDADRQLSFFVGGGGNIRLSSSGEERVASLKAYVVGRSSKVPYYSKSKESKRCLFPTPAPADPKRCAHNIHSRTRYSVRMILKLARTIENACFYFILLSPAIYKVILHNRICLG